MKKYTVLCILLCVCLLAGCFGQQTPHANEHYSVEFQDGATVILMDVPTEQQPGDATNNGTDEDISYDELPIESLPAMEFDGMSAAEMKLQILNGNLSELNLRLLKIYYRRCQEAGIACTLPDMQTVYDPILPESVSYYKIIVYVGSYEHKLRDSDGYVGTWVYLSAAGLETSLAYRSKDLARYKKNGQEYYDAEKDAYGYLYKEFGGTSEHVFYTLQTDSCTYWVEEVYKENSAYIRVRAETEQGAYLLVYNFDKEELRNLDVLEFISAFGIQKAG